MRESNAYINLNYTSRKAVINLSLKQLKNITGTDADLTEYPHIFSENMFSEYPRRLKVIVMLPSEYEDTIAESQSGDLKKISEMESRIKELEAEVKTLRSERDSLKEDNKEQELSIHDLKKDIEHISSDNEDNKTKLGKAEDMVDALKDYKFYDYQIRKDKVNRTLNSLEHISIWDFIKKEHKAIIKRYYEDVKAEETLSRDRVFHLGETTSTHNGSESENKNGE